MRRTGLTHRQEEVFELVLLGKSRPEIADALGVSANCVNIFINRIAKEMGLSVGIGHRVTTPLVLLAVREGWLRQGPGRTLEVSFPALRSEVAHAA